MGETERKIINKVAYRQDYFPPKPTAMTKYFRTCKLWQFIRFISINLKMLKVVAASHH
jgi:hypothetical protein